MATTIKLKVESNLSEEVNGASKSLRELKVAYKDALDEVAKGTAGATEKAGELRDQINDVNESVNEFAGGSKFEVFGNVLGGVGSK